MTKIEERAQEWAENHFDEEYKGAAFISYVKGAASQEAIDIEKAVEWFKSIQDCFEDEYMTISGSLHKSFIEDFRNAMKE